MIKKLLLAVTFLLMAFSVDAAPVIQADVSFNWDSFTWKTIDYFNTGSQPTIQWIESSKKDSTNVSINGANIGWGTNNSNVDAVITASNSEVSGSIAVTQGTYKSTPDISLSASRYGEFQVAGSGLVMFEVDYNRNIEFNDDPSLYGNGYCNINTNIFMEISNPPNSYPQNPYSFSVSSNANNSSSYYSDENYSSKSLNGSVDGDSYYYNCYEQLDIDGNIVYKSENGDYPDFNTYLSQSGKLIIPMFFNDGDMGSILAGVQTSLQATVNAHAPATVNTPVPVPAAIWLFGSGLVGLVVTRRKLKK